MELELGIKSDPIEYRFSYDWLFEILNKCEIHNMQLGSFFELYSVEDGFFHELREKAEKYGIRIKSCFTTHRELGGFFTNNKYLEKTARLNYERYINVASILGADYMGSNPGAVYRDRIDYKQQGIECYLSHMKELMQLAQQKGLKGLSIEPMSCSAEPPATPDEITSMMDELKEYHQQYKSSTVPVYLCGDISHGVADKDENIIYTNYELFEFEIPYLVEFHFKNTDSIFNSTFGFSNEEVKRGIIDLDKIKAIIHKNNDTFPTPTVTGYLEISGPKTGRDYSDYKLKAQLIESLQRLNNHFRNSEAETQPA